MALAPRLDLRPAQTLVMTPQLQQSLRLLALSNLELEAAVAEEVAGNPLLDLAEESVKLSADRDTGDSAPEPAGADELIASLGGLADQPLDHDWREAAGDADCWNDVAASGGEEPFDFDRLGSRDESLAAHLLAQLASLRPPLRDRAAAIIRELDEAGYLATPLDVIAASAGAPLAAMETALRAVQKLDPPGIAARSLAECLALQAIAADRYDPAMARLIDHLDLLARGNLPSLRRICGVDDEDLAAMIAELRAFDPKPGWRFAAGQAPAIAPDLFVRRTADGWAVEVNRATLPRLRVDRHYHRQLRSAAGGRQDRAWLGERLARADWLVRALEQRASTMVRITRAIVARQEGFFAAGVTALRPLTLAQVADATGLHESTVSRAATGKYLECERGLFELRSFFGPGVAVDGGEAAAAAAVKAAIARLVATESEVLSDDQLVDRLRRQGFDLARRTVAKYREAIGIGSSVQRRRQRAIRGLAA